MASVPQAVTRALVIVLGGLVVWAVLAGMVYSDYAAVRGYPVEHSAVVSVSAATSERVACYRDLRPRTVAEIVTLRSDNPPPGKPFEFAWPVCPGTYTVGERLTVVRVDDSPDGIYVDPVLSIGDVYGISGGITAFLALVLGVMTAGRHLTASALAAWRRRRGERAAGHVS